MDDKKKILYITSRHSISPTGCWRVHDDFVIISKNLLDIYATFWDIVTAVNFGKGA